MLAVGGNCPFIPHHAPISVTADLAWWSMLLTNKAVPIPSPSQFHSSISALSLMPVWGLESPLLLKTDGGPGDLYQIGKPSTADTTLDGLKQSDLSSSLDLSQHSIPLHSITDFIGTTKELSKDGGMDVVETLQSTTFSNTYRIISIAWTQQSTFILSKSPVLRILQIHPHKVNMDLPISYYCPLTFHQSCFPSSSILNQGYQPHN